MKPFASCVALAVLAVLLPSSAGAEPVTIDSATGKGCLDFDYGDRFKSKDYDAHGANVVVFSDCHGKDNQTWSINGKIISTAFEGVRYCLDLNRGAPVLNGKGYNIIGWSDCHGASIQQWTREGNTLTVTWDNRKFCLDVDERDEHKVLAGGTSYNVIAWPCHRGKNQQWRITK